jgi:hypothetical protein
MFPTFMYMSVSDHGYQWVHRLPNGAQQTDSILLRLYWYESMYIFIALSPENNQSRQTSWNRTQL